MPHKGFHHSEKSKRAMSRHHKGLKPWNKDIKMTVAQKKNIMAAKVKGLSRVEWMRQLGYSRKNKPSGFTGWHHSEKSKKDRSKRMRKTWKDNYDLMYSKTIKNGIKASKSPASKAHLKKLQKLHKIHPEWQEEAHKAFLAGCPYSKDTKIERLVQYYFKCHNVKFETQKYIRFKDGRHCFADVYLPEYNLIIFCDGYYWHHRPGSYQRDKYVTRNVAEVGYDVLRLDEQYILSRECFEDLNEVF